MWLGCLAHSAARRFALVMEYLAKLLAQEPNATANSGVARLDSNFESRT
jgi:hypothetical protein